MKKTSSKILALVLVLIMVMSLVACGESGEDDGIVINVAGVQGTTADWASTDFVKYVEEKFGFKMNIENFIDGSHASTQYSTMLASGTAPDLFVGMGMDKNIVNLDGADGYWLDFSEYLDIMPNLRKMLDTYPDFKQYVTSADGSIYFLTRVQPVEAGAFRGMMYYNKAEVAAAGVTGEIKTITEFEAALRKVKEAYPDKIPLAITFDDAPAYNADIILRTAFGIPFADNSYMIYEDANGNVQLGDISENNKAYLTWLAKLEDDGLLKVYTDGKNAYRSDLAEGKFVFWSETNGAGSWPADQNVFGVIAALTHAPYTTQSSYLLNAGITTQARIFVNAETAYPEEICQFIDYLCSEEGKYMAVYGQEGKHFDLKTDAFGVDYIEIDKYAIAAGYTKDDGSADTANFTNTVVVPNQAFAMYWGFMGEDLDTMTAEQLAQIAETPSTTNPNQWSAIIALALSKVDNVTRRPDVLLAYTEDEAAARKTPMADLKTYLVTQKLDFIRNGVTDDAWNAYVNQVKTTGWNTLQPIEQAAWDRAYPN